MTRVIGRLPPPTLPFWPGKSYLVGGAVRDLLLGFPVTDFDFATPEPRNAAASCARVTGGTLFPLDEKRDHWRVVAGKIVYDFAPIAGSLTADLARRDYTVNAMALSRSGAIWGFELALSDLKGGILRAVSQENLHADPLRPLRGWRIWISRGLRPEPRTKSWIVAAARQQRFRNQPAAERVREELNRVLLLPRAAWGFAKLRELGLSAAYLRELDTGAGVEQFGYHHLDVLNHQLETLHQLVWRFPHSSLALRWAAVLHDVAKPLVRQWDEERGYYRFLGHESEGAAIAALMLERLRYPRPLIKRVKDLIRFHMRTPPAGDRGRRRWLHRYRRMLPDLLMLQIADRAATRGELSAGEAGRLEHLYRALFEAQNSRAKSINPKPLLDGTTIMTELGLVPGPLVGRLLRSLVEAQVVGDVTNRQEALAFVRWTYEAETKGLERPTDT
ncbi:HD domain-containing protein [Oceanithermus sp.]